MTALSKEIQDLSKQAEGSNRPVCSLCIVKGRERVVVANFTCEFCQQVKQGSGLRRHVGG